MCIGFLEVSLGNHEAALATPEATEIYLAWFVPVAAPLRTPDDSISAVGSPHETTLTLFDRAARGQRGQTTTDRVSSALWPAIDQPACLTDRSLDGFWFQYVHENAHANTILDVLLEDVASG
jgi:hypothetical protein